MRFFFLVLSGMCGMLVSVPHAPLAQTVDTFRVEVQAPSRPQRGIDRVRTRLHGQRTSQPTVVVIVPPREALLPTPTSASSSEGVRERVVVPAETNAAQPAVRPIETSLIPPLPPLQGLTSEERARLEAISPGLAHQLQQQLNVVTPPSAAQDRIIVVNVPYVPPPVVPETLVVERRVDVFTESPPPVMGTVERRPLVPPFEAPRAPIVVERVVDRVVERPGVESRLLQTSLVYFEHNTYTPLAGTEQLLQPLAGVLVQFPDLRLEVIGHTDSTGSDAVNLRISLERAEAVRNYLISQFNVRPEQLVARGVGAAEPLVSNRTANGRALNRRVEFRALAPEPPPEP